MIRTDKGFSLLHISRDIIVGGMERRIREEDLLVASEGFS
jgi:hypothetical protein